MIARLEGRLVEHDGARLVLDVHGVGYELDVTSSVLGLLTGIGSPLVLHTHLVVREDGQYLFGFASRAEREMFRALIKVNGIGPKVAMALLSAMPLAALASAIANESLSLLTRVPGVGRKTAERLVIELRDKLGSVATGASVAMSPSAPRSGDPIADDAESALIALGFKPAEASRWVGAVLGATSVVDNQAVESETLPVEEVVRLALRAAADRR